MIATKRKPVQYLTTIAVVAIPFLHIGGESLLRLDAASRTLLFFGARIRIEEFHLLLLATLIVVFGFLFITMVLGRVWCGWFCPQTTLSDLTEWVSGRLSAFLPKALALALQHLCCLCISFLVASNLIWYFIPPAEYLRRLVNGELGTVAGITLAVVFCLIYLDLAFVRRLLCKTVCPYGRIQMMTTDRNTLTLQFDPARRVECLRCGACLRNCPMGIDIRQGMQIECINCGRCLDACAHVMAKRGSRGLFGYSFGSKESGGGSPVSARSLLLGTLVVLLCGALAFGIATRSEATLKVRQAALGEAKVVDGAVVNFYTAYLENRDTTPALFELRVAAPKAVRAQIMGPVSGIEVAANANRRVDFAVQVAGTLSGTVALELQLVRNGRVVAESRLPFLKAAVTGTR